MIPAVLEERGWAKYVPNARLRSFEVVQHSGPIPFLNISLRFDARLWRIHSGGLSQHARGLSKRLHARSQIDRFEQNAVPGNFILDCRLAHASQSDALAKSETVKNKLLSCEMTDRHDRA